MQFNREAASTVCPRALCLLICHYSQEKSLVERKGYTKGVETRSPVGVEGRGGEGKQKQGETKSEDTGSPRGNKLRRGYVKTNELCSSRGSLFAGCSLANDFYKRIVSQYSPPDAE